MYPTKRKLDVSYMDDMKEDPIKKHSIPFHYEGQYQVYRSGSREVNFSCTVNNRSIEYFKKCILDIINDNQSLLIKREKSDGEESDDTEPFVITYIINTGGGCLNSTFGFVGFINAQRKKYVNIKFSSVIIGCSCSAGTILAVIADNRKMDRFSIGMLHEFSGGYSSTYTHLMSKVKNDQNTHDFIIELYIENTGRDINNKDHVKEIDDMLRLETWMTAQEYLKAGFIDEIIGTEVWVSRNKRPKTASKIIFPGYKHNMKKTSKTSKTSNSS